MGLVERRRSKAERRVLEAFETIGWHYGLDLMRRAGMRSGRFYPALFRLEQCGWVEADMGRQQARTASPLPDVPPRWAVAAPGAASSWWCAEPLVP